MLFDVGKQKISSHFLSDTYIVPPFSVFNTFTQYWRERLKAWSDLGLYTSDGRDAKLAYDNRRIDKHRPKQNHNGTSIFNPVVAEILIRWFSRKDDIVFDPFAGSITRGAISCILDRQYVGIDLSKSQVDANIKWWKSFTDKYDVKYDPEWICGDSVCEEFHKCNMIFTCPPYYNLEQYSDDPKDLSNCDNYNDFLNIYTKILRKCYNILVEDSFACIVVSDIRDKRTTEYYGFVADTVKAMQSVGFKFYNEIILFNQTGNLAITSGNYFDTMRKVGRQHQNILVFYKGDTKHIKEKFGKFEEARRLI